MSETEIKLRNAKLRLWVNIILVALFVILAIWQASGSISARALVRDLSSQITVLEKDTAKNEQSFLTEQTLSEQSRRQTTAQGMVEESQRLQALRDRLENARSLLQDRQDRRDKLQKEIGMHHLIILIGLVGALILLGVNYLLDY